MIQSLNNPFSLAEKRILITGASSGLGREVAIAASNAGANVLLMGRNESELKTTRSLCNPDVKSVCLSINLLDNRELKEKITAIAASDFGKISGVVHAAGVMTSIPLSILNESQVINEYQVNVGVGIQLLRFCSSIKVLAPEGASFVFFSSVTAIKGSPALVSYTSTKGAIISMVKSAAAELAAKKVRVNAIVPGYIGDTGMFARAFPDEMKENIKNKHPLGLGEASDIAYPVIFLLSSASKWMTGASLVIDGGFSI